MNIEIAIYNAPYITFYKKSDSSLFFMNNIVYQLIIHKNHTQFQKEFANGEFTGWAVFGGGKKVNVFEIPAEF